MEVSISFIVNTADLYLDAAPWLLFGLLAAGLVKAWVPEEGMRKWLGGRGPRPVLLAALAGAPLPICSCGVLPAAVGLRRAGASREATVSFMISTPETGVDSVAVSYALLGPFMAIARPIAAVTGAVFTGMLMTLLPDGDETKAEPACCGSSCRGGPEMAASDSRRPAFAPRTVAGIRYAMTDILDDLAVWLGVGLLMAGAVATFAPPQVLAEWGSGPLAMLVMLVVGIPMYICATASTPVAAGLLVAGVSPGAVMVFLLAGPATNMATVTVVRREMGTAASALYLLGIAVSSIAAGIAVDATVDILAIDMAVQLSAGGEIVPRWLAVMAAALLAALAFRPIFLRCVRALTAATAVGHG
jgi:uncharacterized protein